MNAAPPSRPVLGAEGSHRRASGDNTRFLLQALRRPHQIGAIAPSGPHVAAQAAALIAGDAGPQVVVELGPGSGVITDALAARLPHGNTLTAVEINADLAAHLARTRPGVNVLHADAAELPRLLRDAGIPPADLIVSALPWSVMSDDAQQRLLTGIAAALHPRGAFATLLTLPVRPLPAARRLRRRLDTTFACVTRTRTIWRNVPPAHLYVCRNVRRPPTGADRNGQRPVEALAMHGDGGHRWS